MGSWHLALVIFDLLLTHGKRLCLLSILRFACTFVKVDQAFLFTLKIIQYKVDSDKFVHFKLPFLCITWVYFHKQIFA